MRVARILGAFGKTVISIGLIILLFGIFQLWGTGVIEARAQQDLESEFDDLLEASSSLRPPTPEPTPAATLEPTPEPTPDPTKEPAGPEQSRPVLSTPTPTPEPTPEPTPTPELTPEPTADPAWLELLYPGWGSPVARIHIPSLEVSKAVVEGVRVSDLRKGPGHYPNTPLPGQAGNAAIAGHRTTYGAPFGEIDKLVPGNQIFVETLQGRFVYEVIDQGDGVGHFIVAPSAVEVLNQNFGEYPNRLTLTACHPKNSARQRIIVVAELKSAPVPSYRQLEGQEQASGQLADENVNEAVDPTATVTPSPTATSTAAGASDAPTLTPAYTQEAPATPTAEADGEPPEQTPIAGAGAQPPSEPQSPAPSAQASVPTTESFGEGLDGDPDAWPPAILWGLAALAIWFFAMFVGRRWKKLPAYSLAAVPFLVVMFMAFWHIDRIIPSY